MNRLAQLLDSDWARLSNLAGFASRKRGLLDFFTPRFAPVALVRIAQLLHASGWPRLAKLTALVNFVLFGLEVPPRISIGRGFVLMHTQGTVLGAASIGNDVTIYHQVTLGAVEMDFSYTSKLRPLVEDGVIISAGAKVLGGLTLGQGSVIGANAVVLNDVPPGYVAVGIPAKNLPPKNVRPHGITLKEG